MLNAVQSKVMPPRDVLVIETRGERFRFYYELKSPELLHITAHHGTTPQEAIDTFFVGQTSVWDQVHARFETFTETHGIYWTRHPIDQSVIIITCFRIKEEEEY